MLKSYLLTHHGFVINFSKTSCQTPDELLASRLFRIVVKNYIEQKDSQLKVSEKTKMTKLELDQLIQVFSLLYTQPISEVKQHSLGKQLLKDKHGLFKWIQGLYDYYRQLERYGVHTKRGLDVHELVSTNDKFNALVLDVYRTISEKLLGRGFFVYRQLPAGVQVSYATEHIRVFKDTSYSQLFDIRLITNLMMRPPINISSAVNTRKGTFKERIDNPIVFQPNLVDKNTTLGFPIRVGSLVGIVYLQMEYLHHAVALANLFHPADKDTLLHHQPDFMMFYGVPTLDQDHSYYYDDVNHLYVGYVIGKPSNDYFGYVKKMVLTLHNLTQIKRRQLPIHGAMVQVTTTNQQVFNLVFIGDSGAGKSETLEALRVVGKHTIRDMNIVFDDMGTFLLENNQVVAQGTEIGAFIRLDDLESGYAYKSLDRAIFLNADQVNARVVLPVSTYDFITQSHPIDYVFYANNYTSTTNGVVLYDQLADVLPFFIEGQRMAKGTTNEQGIVGSFFANPFGPLQEQEQTLELIHMYFDQLMKQGTKIGVLHTQLGILGRETEGPRQAAQELLNILTK